MSLPLVAGSVGLLAANGRQGESPLLKLLTSSASSSLEGEARLGGVESPVAGQAGWREGAWVPPRPSADSLAPRRQ